jgi:hypothetical protein
MAHDDMMLQVIPNDFTVELIWNEGPDALFGALRKGGREVIAATEGSWETHTCGVWHFVAPASAAEAGPIQRCGIRQWHVPRYTMAEALDEVRLDCGEKATGGRYRLVGPEFAIGVNSAGTVYWIPGPLGGRAIAVPPAMLKLLEADISRLQSARSLIAETNGGYSYDGIRTAAGHQIRHESRRLVEAIAFEKKTLPRLQAGNFGIYSAFCTFRDFDVAREMPDDLMQMLVLGQWNYDVSDVSSDVMEMFVEVQRRLLSQPIWGPGLGVSESEAARILGKGMRTLRMEKRVQFVLMNGMHGAGLFLPLAVLTDCIDFEQYAQYVTQGFAQDSGEEQDRRKHVAYIALYGELAASR